MSREDDGRDPDDPGGDSSDGDLEGDGEWRFTLEDIEAREAEVEAAAEARNRRTEPIEPGTPSLENAAFVLLGVAFALFILSRLFVG